MKNLSLVLLAGLFALASFGAEPAAAASASEIETQSQQALQHLYRTNPIAESIAKKAKAVLVFPKIVKAGFIFGGSYGEGALMKDGVTQGFYNSVSGSWGLQAGAQSYGYALFIISDKSLNYLNQSQGWEIGVGPTVVMVDAGVAKNLSTSTLKDDAYAFIFDQQGLMAGLSIEGSKVSRITR